MAINLDIETLSTLREDVVKHRKFYVSHLSDDLLETSLPEGLPEPLKDKVQLRRSKALQFRRDPTWSDRIFQAVTDLTSKRNDSQALLEIRQSHLLNPLEDYVNHLLYFSQTAKEMESKGLRVVPQGPNCSRVHDLDKLDPLMLVGLAERFEDGLETQLWSVCVANHVTNSPHHPEHHIWQPDGICSDLDLPTNECPHCEGKRFLGVREMICDRVSRRVQKELGQMGPAAWDISPKWFSDLPTKWFDTAVSQIEHMKRN